MWITECERMGLKVLAPDVNESFADFSVVKGNKTIRFGLSAIKNVGTNVAKGIVDERKQNGPYKTLEDFLTRCGGVVNKKTVMKIAIPIKIRSKKIIKKNLSTFFSFISICW